MMIALDAEKIKKLTQNKSYEIEVFQELTSTNDYLASLSQDNKVRICLAETQTQGRGRFQRPWHSPFGQNIYFSMLYPFTSQATEWGGLSLAVGLSVCKVLEKITNHKIPLQIKWPNDILCEGQKISGILIDIYKNYVIIGVGINVNVLESQEWTSLKELTKQDYDRNIIAAHLIDTLFGIISLFEKSGLTPFLEDWKARDYLYGKTITLKTGNVEVTGKILGINTSGNLAMRSDHGQVHYFSSGDATIVKQ